MATGKILRFDWSHGYGFIAPDEGGEDVFLHANEIADDDRELVRTGAVVEFVSIQGGRGYKAVEVAFPGGSREGDTANWSGGNVEESASNGYSVEEAELSQHVTELLINLAPNLTGIQIVEVRRGLVAYAREQGWLTP